MKSEPTEALNLLTTLGIDHRLVRHAPVMTVEESMTNGVAAQIGSDDHHVLKNLLLQEKKGMLILLIARGDQRVDLKLVATEIGSKRLSFAKPETVEHAFGTRSGAVSLFDMLDAPAHVHLAIDSGIFDLTGTTGFHAGSNDSTVVFKVSDLPAVAAAIQPEYSSVQI
ncbi:MAG: YbaK/EbsC family protein [Ancrocorticia sp.]|uniref:YbaK/EbsC family protein n=1 Tax=Ancrocorticia sp. TaxID=2593684 RepID=UPI003F8DFCC6